VRWISRGSIRSSIRKSRIGRGVMSMPSPNHIRSGLTQSCPKCCLLSVVLLLAPLRADDRRVCDDDQLLTSEVMAVRMGLTATQLNDAGKSCPQGKARLANGSLVSSRYQMAEEAGL